MIKYNQKKKRIFYFRLSIIGSYIIIIVLVLLFSDMGYFKLRNLKNKKESLDKEIQTKKNILIKLEKEKIRLEEDLEYIEQIAREEFKMAKQGEKVFTIVKNQHKKGKN